MPHMGNVCGVLKRCCIVGGDVRLVWCEGVANEQVHHICEQFDQLGSDRDVSGVVRIVVVMIIKGLSLKCGMVKGLWACWMQTWCCGG